MPEEISTEMKFAQTVSKLFAVLGIKEIPEAVIKQIAVRMGSKPNITAETKLTEAFDKLSVTRSRNYVHPDVEVFDVAEAGGGISPKDDDYFNGHKFRLSMVTEDLFAFADFIQLSLRTPIQRDIRSPSGYQALHEIVQEYLNQCQKGIFRVDDKVTKYFQNICIAAQRVVLGKEQTVDTEKVKKYQKYLDVQRSLAPFGKLGKAREFADAKALLEIPYIAEKAIEIIMREDFDYSESVAIYNRRFGCAYEPYSGIAVVCAGCYTVNRFEKLTYAEKCGNCAADLFRKCHDPECGATLSQGVTTCPSCGARLSDVRLFTRNIAMAKEYIKEGHIEQAEICLITARAIAPQNKAELDSLGAQIVSSKTERDKTLAELEALISRRAYYAAEKKLADAKKKLKGTVLSSVEQRIVSAQSNADKKFVEAKDSIEELQKVIAICADHPGALEAIRNRPPSSPANLSISEGNGYLQLSWDTVPEIDIKYKLVRKKDSPPATAFDGEVVEITEKSHARDNTPVPGRIHYAVFALRENKLSLSGAASSILYLPEVTDLSLRQLNDRVEISYRIPKGAVGVRVERESGNQTASIYSGTKTIAEDHDYPEQCSYTVTALFDGRESRGKTVPFTATALPEKMEAVIRTDRDNVSVSWETVQKGLEVRVLSVTNENFALVPGTIYADGELSGNVTDCARAPCEDKMTQFSVNPNQEYTIAVMLGNANGWMCCVVDSVYFGSFPGLKRQAVKYGLKGEHYFWFGEELSPSIKQTLIAISSVDSTPDEKEFKPVVIERIFDTSVPRFKQVIKIQNIGQVHVGRRFIFCRFVLDNGKTSPPVGSEVHFRQDIQAQVNLKGKGTKLKADIRFKLQRFDYGFTELPELMLSVDGAQYNIERVAVVPNRTDYSVTVNLQLPAPIVNMMDVKLVTADPVFASDFTINYKR